MTARVWLPSQNPKAQCSKWLGEVLRFFHWQLYKPKPIFFLSDEKESKIRLVMCRNAEGWEETRKPVVNPFFWTPWTKYNVTLTKQVPSKTKNTCGYNKNSSWESAAPKNHLFALACGTNSLKTLEFLSFQKIWKFVLNFYFVESTRCVGHETARQTWRLFTSRKIRPSTTRKSSRQSRIWLSVTKLQSDSQDGISGVVRRTIVTRPNNGAWNRSHHKPSAVLTFVVLSIKVQKQH